MWILPEMPKSQSWEWSSGETACQEVSQHSSQGISSSGECAGLGELVSNKSGKAQKVVEPKECIFPKYLTCTWLCLPSILETRCGVKQVNTNRTKKDLLNAASLWTEKNVCTHVYIYTHTCIRVSSQLAELCWKVCLKCYQVINH